MKKTLTLTGAVVATIAGVLLMSDTPEAAGPPGIMNVQRGVVLVLAGTNQTPVIVFKELTTGLQQTVGRYVHDRAVYGDSVFLDGGYEWSPPDRPHGAMMFARNVSATNRYVIEHPQ